MLCRWRENDTLILSPFWSICMCIVDWSLKPPVSAFDRQLYWFSIRLLSSDQLIKPQSSIDVYSDFSVTLDPWLPSFSGQFLFFPLHMSIVQSDPSDVIVLRARILRAVTCGRRLWRIHRAGFACCQFGPTELFLLVHKSSCVKYVIDEQRSICPVYYCSTKQFDLWCVLKSVQK